MDPSEVSNADADQMPLGSLQKGDLDILDAKVTIAANPDAASAVVVHAAVPVAGSGANAATSPGASAAGAAGGGGAAAAAASSVRLDWLVRVESECQFGAFEVRRRSTT